MVSGGYRFMAGIGLAIGCGLLVVGVLMIVGQIFWDALLPYIENYGVGSFIQPFIFTPMWIVWGIFVAGCLVFLWGFGLFRIHDWAPFATSIFFTFLGVYLSLFVALVYWGNIPGISLPRLDFGGSDLTNQLVEGGIILAPAVLAMFIGAFVLFRSDVILDIYEGKYLGYPSRLSTCPTCRSRLESRNALCKRCNPPQRLAALLSENSTHRHELRFTPDRTIFKLGRYDENIDSPDSNTLYFNVERNPDYRRISEHHAEVRFDEVSGKFSIRDLGSRNKTFVNEVIVDEGEEYEIMDGDEIKLGDVLFRFETDSNSE